MIKSGIARLEEIRGPDGSLENLYVRVSGYGEVMRLYCRTTDIGVQVDRGKVLTHGRDAAGKLLVELQVRKSTADGAGARSFYTELTTPLPGWEGEIRDLVLKKKQVR